MIRRLPHESLLESIIPQPVSGGRALHVVTPLHDEVTPAEELDAQAYRNGYAEGFQAGEEDGRREAEQYQQAWEEETKQALEEEYRGLVQERENLAALVAGLNEQLQSQHQVMEQLAFELALASLTQAFGSMQDDGALLQRLCQQMAEDYRGKLIRLEVSAADRANLPEHIAGLELVAEHGLSQGECRIVTARGYAESSIAARLDAIHDAMLEAVGVKRP
jgi:flagellar biosynthesis/type III secretory pathway protein FliH